MAMSASFFACRVFFLPSNLKFAQPPEIVTTLLPPIHNIPSYTVDNKTVLVFNIQTKQDRGPFKFSH